ncbi:MAG TPA: hypothetical protein VGO62_03325 [Myxococcota bacterium]|jgi:hypothetical protein
MKWIVLIALIMLVANRKNLLGGLLDTAKKLPQDFKDAEKAAADPASAAKPVQGDEQPKS